MQTNKPSYVAQISDDGIPLDAPDVASVVAGRNPPHSDDWLTRDRMRHMGRELRRSGRAARSSLGHVPTSSRRFEPPTITFDDIKRAISAEAPPIAPLPIAATITSPRPRERSQVVAWLIVLVGALLLAGGLGLVGWSLSAPRPDIWNPGLGLTLGGQGTLIFGLVLVVSRLWRNSRYATGKLQNVHAQLVELQRTADSLAAMRTGSAGAFYADLARGASPQVLLTNLKGQVDHLAARLGNG